MSYVVIIACCFIFSFACQVILHYRVASGTLQIDHSNPEKDIYRIVIDQNDLDKLASKKKIVLKIDNNADLSQK